MSGALHDAILSISEELRDFATNTEARAYELGHRDARHAAAELAIAAPDQEPVAYQYRTSPVWKEDKDRWPDWVGCSREQADEFERTPVLHDWEYQVRRLYAAPQAQPAVQADLTYAEIIAVAIASKSADPGRDGYILPISFACALMAAQQAKSGVTPCPDDYPEAYDPRFSP
jgi:hypothetical protein